MMHYTHKNLKNKMSWLYDNNNNNNISIGDRQSAFYIAIY